MLRKVPRLGQRNRVRSKITEDQNPVISIQVTGVDIEPILPGRRDPRQPRQPTQEDPVTPFDQLGIPDTKLFTSYESRFVWSRFDVSLRCPLMLHSFPRHEGGLVPGAGR